MSDSPTNRLAREHLTKTYDILLKVAFPVLLGACGWTFANLTDHEKRITVLEHTAVTKEDAEREARLLREQIGLMRADLAGVRATLESLEDALRNR